jgi:hypothetical protein
VKVVHLPLRITVGASILNTDRSKQGLKGEAAAGVHVTAVGAVPAVRQIPTRRFPPRRGMTTRG